MNKQKFVKYLWRLWDHRNTDFDNLLTGAGHKLKAGYTCRFRKKDCHVEFTGTVMYSNSKCAYVVISNGGSKPYITYLKDAYPVGVSVHWTEYYGDLLKGIENNAFADGIEEWLNAPAESRGEDE